MNIFTLLQGGTPVPNPVTVGELTQDLNAAKDLLKVYQEIGIPLAILLVLGLFVVAFIVNVWVNRNKGKEMGDAFGVLAGVIVRLEARMDKADREAVDTRTQHIESLSTIGDVMYRLADNDDKRVVYNARIATAMEAMGISEAAQQKALVDVKAAVGESTEKVIGAVETSGKHVLSGVGDVMGEQLKEFGEFFIMYIGMLIENPRATKDRFTRVKQAWNEGDMVKAQKVADEENAPAIVDMVGESSEPPLDEQIASGQ